MNDENFLDDSVTSIITILLVVAYQQKQLQSEGIHSLSLHALH